MRGIIIKRLEIPNATLLLNILSDSGKIEKLKIPGILKSSKRNAYFLSPATIWDFTLSGNPREISTPKEYKLIFTPYGFETGYNDLVEIGNLLKPLPYLRPELPIISIYDELEFVIKSWVCGNRLLENFLLDYFYLKFLEEVGLLHDSNRCLHCDTTLNNNDDYHLFSGSICRKCLKVHTHRPDELIPNFWVLQYRKKTDIGRYMENPGIPKFPYQDSLYRNRILAYLKHML